MTDGDSVTINTLCNSANGTFVTLDEYLPITFPGEFSFYMGMIVPTVLHQVLYHHGLSMIVSRFTLFTEKIVIHCNQVTNMFRSGHDCTSTSSARRPCYFRLQTKITIWVLRKVRIYTAYPNLVPLLFDAPLEVLGSVSTSLL